MRKLNMLYDYVILKVKLRADPKELESPRIVNVPYQFVRVLSNRNDISTVSDQRYDKHL